MDIIWLEYRDYRLYTNKLNFNGENILAMRVYDGMLQGGIYEGSVGVIRFDAYKNWRKSFQENKGRTFLIFYSGDN